MLILEILLILLLILCNGFFAMSELAVIYARRPRLESLADEGRRGALAALALAQDPGRFLSAVQIGITLIGILAGAFGGARLSRPVTEVLAAQPWLASWAPELAFALVVGGITYASLIVGELIPKQLALRNAERIACWVAPPMGVLTRAATPLVAVLDASTRLGLRLLGGSSRTQPTVTDEEVRRVLQEATQAGVVEWAEQALISGVMRMADRPVTAIMTPRPDVEWLDLRDEPSALRRELLDTTYSRLLVCDGDIDEVVGLVQAKDLLGRALLGQPLDVRASLRVPPAVPETMSALKTLELLKQSPVHLALVVDEYGSLMGIVTTTDILTAIVGGLREHGEQPERRALRRPDGSWLVDGSLPVDEVGDLLELKQLVAGEDYHTLAGWLLDHFDRVPNPGESLDWHGWRFEVMDMDGFRIDKVLATPMPPEEPPPDHPG